MRVEETCLSEEEDRGTGRGPVRVPAPAAGTLPPEEEGEGLPELAVGGIAPCSEVERLECERPVRTEGPGRWRDEPARVDDPGGCSGLPVPPMVCSVAGEAGSREPECGVRRVGVLPGEKTCANSSSSSDSSMTTSWK